MRTGCDDTVRLKLKKRSSVVFVVAVAAAAIVIDA